MIEDVYPYINYERVLHKKLFHAKKFVFEHVNVVKFSTNREDETEGEGLVYESPRNIIKIKCGRYYYKLSCAFKLSRKKKLMIIKEMERKRKTKKFVPLEYRSETNTE